MNYEKADRNPYLIIHNSSFLLYSVVLGLLVLALLPVGCGPGPAPTPTPGPAPPVTPESRWQQGTHARSLPTPGRLVTPGRLTVGSDAGNPPMEYIDAGGKPVGIDVDVAEEIANRMGLEA